jgi:hypothetical protein
MINSEDLVVNSLDGNFTTCAGSFSLLQWNVIIGELIFNFSASVFTDFD